MKTREYGINIREYVLKHCEALEKGEVTAVQHAQKLAWIQHERLIHLIVMSLTIISMLFCLVLAYIAPDMIGLTFSALAFVLLVLNLFYIRYYFFLENHVQRWYIAMEKIQEKDDEKV